MTADAVNVEEAGDDAAGHDGRSASLTRGASEEELTRLGPLYQGLMSRYNSSIMIRWQTLALGLTAQGFVVGAASQLSPGRLTTAVMLAVVILFIGVATIATGRRFELVALADRHMLDVYETRLLRGPDADLRLQHASSTGRRPGVMLSGEALREYEKKLRKGDVYRILRALTKTGLNHWWGYSQLIISLAGAAIPILGYFDL